MAYQVNSKMMLDGAGNVRELGGYQNVTSQQIKLKKVLRGDDLTYLSELDMATLYDYGVRICIDLRTDQEKPQANPFSIYKGCTYYELPIDGASFPKCPPEEILYHLYIKFLEQEQEKFRKIFEIIAQAEEGVIFHCSAGKDRTGLVAMFLLSICEVERGQILADYAASKDNNSKLIERQLVAVRKYGVTEIPMEVFDSAPETMEKTLVYLEEQFGGPLEYLLKIGVSKDQIASIRKKMLEG